MIHDEILAYHDEVGDEDIPVQMGFGASAGNPDPIGKHRHSFQPFDGSSPYFKNSDARVGYLALFCDCGEVIERIVEDRR